MSTRAKLTLCAALATALASLCLTPLVHTPTHWVLQAFLLIGATAGVGAGLRAAPLPRVLVVPVQLLLVFYLLMFSFVQDTLAYGVLPGPKAFDALGSLLASGGEDIRTYTIPAPPTDGLRLILVGSVTLIAVLVDALAVTWRRAAAAGLPLLALYSVGTGLSGGVGGSWLWFLTAALGYLLLIHTEGQDRLGRWGRVFTGSGRSNSGTLSHGGHGVGLIALVAALLLPAFVPHAGLGLVGGFGSGSGSGGGIGRSQESSLDPMVALTANLTRTDNVELLRFTTDAPYPRELYLRIAALDTFDGVQWTFGQQKSEALPASLPRPDGLEPDVPANKVTTSVAVSETLNTQWLPLPYPASRVQVPGHWQFDAGTRSVSGEGKQRTNGLNYQVASLDVRPTLDQLRAAGQQPKAISDTFLTVPANLPPVVKETALQVTAGKKTPYDKAAALQTWFSTGPFTYSTKVEPRTGPDAIAKFLQDKNGFCVHFAATMAAMARTLGIPARVAIGFTPGTPDGNNTYVVKSTDYHAWPELYFPGSGWTRFEPTPSRGTAPAFTRDTAVPAPSASAQQPTTAPTQSAAPAPSSTSTCTPEQRKTGDCTDEGAVAQVTTRTPAWWATWPAQVVFAITALLLVLLATPMLLRARIRRRRLGSGRYAPGAEPRRMSEAQVLAAWQELVDSAWDLGIQPDDARTPRATVRQLTEAAELEGEAAAAAGRVALATERALYARELEPQAPLGPDVKAARAGIRASTGRLGRIRAVLLPASTVRVWWRIADRTDAFREAGRARVGRITGAVRSAAGRLRRRS
ncbi:transglutaminaseTgpA domain-containing protein [Kitasatospora camelliae]|uniref:TransglutaminaseTgpA domain-containing protein n=1 Tax=Kitasatospora camelliae TaxID=3156397 RepID=A0AAU8JTL3_9ACTN